MRPLPGSAFLLFFLSPTENFEYIYLLARKVACRGTKWRITSCPRKRHVYKSVACEKSFKSSSSWPNPVNILLASEPKGGCPQRSASFLGWLPWLKVQKTEVLRMACDWGQMQMGLPRYWLAIQMSYYPYNHQFPTLWGHNFRVIQGSPFPHCFPYLCTNYLWSQNIQMPDTSCYPQQTLISRNHNPSSVLLMLHPSWSAYRHLIASQAVSLFLPLPLGQFKSCIFHLKDLSEL